MKEIEGVLCFLCLSYLDEVMFYLRGKIIFDFFLGRDRIYVLS